MPRIKKKREAAVIPKAVNRCVDVLFGHPVVVDDKRSSLKFNGRPRSGRVEPCIVNERRCARTCVDPDNMRELRFIADQSIRDAECPQPTCMPRIQVISVEERAVDRKSELRTKRDGIDRVGVSGDELELQQGSDGDYCHTVFLEPGDIVRSVLELRVRLSDGLGLSADGHRPHDHEEDTDDVRPEIPID